MSMYTEILGRFYGFYRPCCADLAPIASRILPDFTVRQEKVPSLLADLHYLGANPAALPLCGNLPSYPNKFAALGGLYVIEGATLGGQIISRHLRRTFPFPAGLGDTFFRSYGDKVGQMWSSFRTVLLTYSSPSADGEIIHAAQQTFDALHVWFEETK